MYVEGRNVAVVTEYDFKHAKEISLDVILSIEQCKSPFGKELWRFD